MSMRYEAKKNAYQKFQAKLAQFGPGRLVLAEVTIGKDKLWLPGQIKKQRSDGQTVVEVEYKDMSGERRFQTMMVDLHQLRLAKENPE